MTVAGSVDNKAGWQLAAYKRKSTPNRKMGTGLLAFWFLNDFLERQELFRQIEIFKSKGFDGYILHGRSGLMTPYLSESWFAAIGDILEKSRQLGMEVWFYDEEPYPSGAAGGTIVRDMPEAKARALSRKVFECKGGTRLYEQVPWGRILLANAHRLDRKSETIDLRGHIGPVREDWCLSYQDCHYHAPMVKDVHLRAFSQQPQNYLLWDVPAGMWRVEVYCEVVNENFKYWGSYVDFLDQKVAGEFIKRSYDSYIERFASYFGNPVMGFFIDEPVLSPHGHLPWSRKFAEHFHQLNGYEIIHRLPMLFDPLPNNEQIRHDFWHTVINMWEEGFWKPLASKLSAHNLSLIGHLDNQPSPWVNARSNGGMHRWQRAFAIGGCDNLFLYDDGDDPLLSHSPRISSTASRRLGQPGSLCESFACTHWSVRLAELKYQTEWLVANGVSRIVPHAAFYSIAGLRRHDAAPSHFVQSPSWPAFEIYSDYARSLCELSGKIKTNRPVAVLLDEKQFWHVYGDSTRYQQCIETYRHIYQTLISQQIDFDIIDEADVLESEIDGTQLCTSFQRFSVIIVPLFAGISRLLREKLDAFGKNGGNVHVIGVDPDAVAGGQSSQTKSWLENSFAVVQKMSDTLPTNGYLRMYDSSVEVRCDEYLRELLWKRGARPFRVLDSDGNELDHLVVRSFFDEDNAVFLVVNQAKASVEGCIEWNQKYFNGHKVAGCDLYTGTLKRDMTKCSLTVEDRIVFPAKNTAWLALKISPAIQKYFCAHEAGMHSIELPKTWRIQKESFANTLQLSSWKLRLVEGPVVQDGKCVSDSEGIEWIMPIDSQFAKKSIASLSNSAGINLEHAYLEFTATMEADESIDRLLLAWERNRIAPQPIVYVNNRNMSADIKESGLDCNTCCINLQSAILPGKNEIRLVFSLDNPQIFTVMTVPMRLEGSFSLHSDNVLGPAPTEFFVENELPTYIAGYTGELVVETGMVLPDCAAAQFVLPTANPEYLTGCELIVGGRSVGKQAWPPYRWNIGAVRKGFLPLKLRLYVRKQEDEIPNYLKKLKPVLNGNPYVWW